MGSSTLYIQLGLMLVVIIFFMVLPARKRAKQEKDFESTLKVGDKIITKSGIHGKIAELGETTLVIETMSGKLKLERSAISRELTESISKKPAIVADSKK